MTNESTRSPFDVVGAQMDTIMSSIVSPKREVIFSWKGEANEWELELYKECYRASLTFDHYIELIKG